MREMLGISISHSDFKGVVAAIPSSRRDQDFDTGQRYELHQKPSVAEQLQSFAFVSRILTLDAAGIKLKGYSVSFAPDGPEYSLQTGGSRDSNLSQEERVALIDLASDILHGAAYHFRGYPNLSHFRFPIETDLVEIVASSLIADGKEVGEMGIGFIPVDVRDEAALNSLGVSTTTAYGVVIEHEDTDAFGERWWLRHSGVRDREDVVELIETGKYPILSHIQST